MMKHWRTTSAVLLNSAVLGGAGALYMMQAEPDIHVPTDKPETSRQVRDTNAFSEMFGHATLSPRPEPASAEMMALFRYDENSTPLNPFLIMELEESPDARAYLRQIVISAEMRGLPWDVAANQLYRESNGFSKAVITGERHSDRGAIGIAQFIPAAMAEVGFTEAEMTDPFTAIEVYASHMTNLRRQNNGDLGLALIEYNGGQGAINFIKQGTNNPNVTGEEALAFLQTEYEERTGDRPHAYHTETRRYLDAILFGKFGDEVDPDLVETQNRKRNDPYFVSGLVDEQRNMGVVYPVYVEAATLLQAEPPTERAVTHSPRPHARPVAAPTPTLESI